MEKEFVYPDWEWLPDGKYTVKDTGEVFAYGRECKYHKMANGGYFVRLSGNGNNRSVTRAAMVLTVFHGNAPSNKHKAHHINGDVTDDRVNNLRWATEKEISHFRMQKKENFERVSQMGKANRGKSFNGKSRRNSKLSKEEVLWIKYALQKGHAEDYILQCVGNKITRAGLNGIKYGYTWKNVIAEG